MFLVAWVAVLAAAPDALACAVCMGNRDSEMVRGAESGVLTLALITYALLMGFGGMIALWIVRSRKLM